MKNSHTHKNFFISCDLPLITIEAIEYIINYKTQKPVVLYKNKNYVEKLCGVYTKECYEVSERLLKNSSLNNSTGKYNVSLSNLLSSCANEIINFEELPFYNSETFLNMNTKEDYSKINELAEIKITPA